MAYILLYIDDIHLTSSHDLHKFIMAFLASEFAMNDLGSVSYFLWIAITKHVGVLFLNQSAYVHNIIVCTDMASSKPFTTPIDTK